MSARSEQMKTLLFSTLYPSSNRPGHGIFVETRLRHLLASKQVDTRVVAPVPWFPSTHERYGKWAQAARVPRHETHNGIEVLHPRYFLPPKVGMNVAPLTLALGARASVARLIRDGFDFDLIDAHYYYPDGVAAALLASWFGKPLVITARGTDLNLIPRYSIPRKWILWAESKAACSIGVCRALMDDLVSIGGHPAKTRVLRNGVDLSLFTPWPQAESRKLLGLPDGALMVSVGHLIERKGHHIAVESLVELPALKLAIVGSGEEEGALRALASSRGVAERVIFAGARPQKELARWYSAADMLVLCSSREGWANVLLEAMACGTPVLATSIPGTVEVVADPVAGRLLAERDAAALVAGARALLENYPDRTAVRNYAEGFDWAETTQGQLDLFHKVLGSGH